ncbi:MAG: alpha/beta hydrolase [Microthrixaceae bacterium]
MTAEEAGAYPGARRPDRRRRVECDGVGISVVEWGEETAPPVLFAHGGFDFAETLNVVAPLLAEGGWRVVSWDQRGHGDSDHADLYSWHADTRDAAAVVMSTTDGPMPWIGHSKGGVLTMQLSEILPHRVSCLINLDGLPSRRFVPDVAEQRQALMTEAALGWLGHRASLEGKQRRPDTIEGLAERRARMNTRLTPEWLRYLVTVGARADADGWRWKIDPTLRMGGLGPWRPEWSMDRLPALGVPFLGVLGLEVEVMGWGTRPGDVDRYLPPDARFEPLEGVGHFVHIEAPERVASLILEFLS